MLRFLVYLIFILSVALAALGIILASRLRNKYKSDIFANLLYFLVFIYAFGFYGIWGRVVTGAFLAPLISAQLLVRISDVAMLLGLPFLIFACLMIIKFSIGLSGRTSNAWFTTAFLIANFLILIAGGYFITRDDTTNTGLIIRDYYIVTNLTYTFIAAFYIHFPWRGRSIIHDHDRQIIAPVIFLIMILQSVLLFFYTTQIWLGLLFILIFFAGNTFLPIYFSYGTLLSAFATTDDENITFEQFCVKFDVSPRESDVVREICNGLSNKEISVKLFISLQTVKDHTHHIYIKTNVKSRVQLINLVKEMIDR